MDFYPPIDWFAHPLHAAAASGSRREVERLVAAGIDVNEQLDMDVTGRQDVAGTPLHVALRNCGDDPSLYRGHHEVVTALLAAGADIRLRRKWEGTPLHDAARFGLTHIAEILISNGADVNSREDYEGRTPLHLAAAIGHLGMVDCLLSKGADIDAVAEWSPPQHACLRIPHDFLPGLTPLQVAARKGSVAVVRKLLHAGACRDVRAAIALAIQSKSETEGRYDEIVSLLSSKAAP